jgi:hypothetical protein
MKYTRNIVVPNAEASNVATVRVVTSRILLDKPSRSQTRERWSLSGSNLCVLRDLCGEKRL